LSRGRAETVKDAVSCFGLCHSKGIFARGASTHSLKERHLQSCGRAARGGLPTPRGGCRRGVFGHTLGVKVVLSFNCM
jgi:hypothetical protein